jgi:hypothetical protein
MALFLAQFPTSPQGRRLMHAALAVCALFWFCAAFSAWSQEAPKGLSEEQVVKLLKEDPAPRVQYLVNKYGIAFYFTPDAEKDLRDAGATPDLLELIRKLAPEKPAEVKPPPPLPPTLVIHAKPGEAEVYVDDERRGQTGADGTLKLGDLTSGSHKLRISLPGYHSYEISVDLNPGQTNTVVAELQPIPPPAPAKEEAPAKDAAKPAPVADEKPHGDPDDPLTPHSPGIYYFEQTGSVRHMIELAEAPPASRSLQTSRGSAFGAFGSFGGGPKWKTMIFGNKAHLRVPVGRPVFYFYASTAEADAAVYSQQNDPFRHNSAPSGLVLVRLQSQKNTREIPAKGNATSATVEEKDTVPFDYENAAAGIYKVQVKSDLGPGEYGFLYGGTVQLMAQTRLFDFGVDKPK